MRKEEEDLGRGGGTVFHIYHQLALWAGPRFSDCMHLRNGIGHWLWEKKATEEGVLISWCLCYREILEHSIYQRTSIQQRSLPCTVVR